MKWITMALSTLAAPMLAVFTDAAPPSTSGLPGDLAEYRQWPPLLEQPRHVSKALSELCMPPTEAQWQAEREEHGPHAQHLIMVYGNPSAAAALSADTHGPFEEGAILAKEKLVPGSKSPDGVGFMVKRSDPRVRDTGGWEFSYFPPKGDARLTHEHCASCHRGAIAKDYVFGDYPAPASGTASPSR
jgi:hypothetical protein